MKQKVLGATLVLGAPVSSLASYSSKGDVKADLTNLSDLGPLAKLEISKDTTNKLIENFKDASGKDANILAEFKKISDTSKDAVIYESTVKGGVKDEFNSQFLKLEVKDNKFAGSLNEIKSDTKIDAGCYIFVIKKDANNIKIEIKNVKDKSKFTDDKGTYKKDE